MGREFLENCLAQRMSLETIGKLVGKHPSTVGYWLRKHGLSAVGSETHAPKGGVDPERLRKLVEEGASIRQIADDLSLGYSTVRHWLKKLGLTTERSVRQREMRRARREGVNHAYLRCPRHGDIVVLRTPRQRFPLRKVQLRGSL